MKEENVKRIIRNEILKHMEGSGFWDELKDIVGMGRAAALPKHKDEKKETAFRLEKPLTDSKKNPETKVRKPNPKLKQRGLLIKQLMKENGLTLAQASRLIKEEGLM